MHSDVRNYKAPSHCNQLTEQQNKNETLTKNTYMRTEADDQTT